MKRFHILLIALFVLYTAMIFLTRQLEFKSILIAVVFGVCLVGLPFMAHKRSGANESKSGNGLDILKHLFAAFALAVALFVVLQVVSIMVGMDATDMIGEKYLPLFMLIATALFFPISRKIIKL